MGGALGGMVRQNWTFHLSSAAWSGNCREEDEKDMYDYICISHSSSTTHMHEAGLSRCMVYLFCTATILSQLALQRGRRVEALFSMHILGFM